MIKIGDLPHRDANGNWKFTQKPELAALSAHTTEGYCRCHCCSERVQTFVVKPGSPFVWCLRCW